MSDNRQASDIAGSSGPLFAMAELTFSGDTAVVPLNALGILSGSEGAWTYTLFVGGAGVVTAGTQRVTLASDDPAVTALQLIDDAIYTDGTGTPSKAIAVAGTDGTNPQILSVTSSGHVNIADGGNIITVDGTVNAAQSGTWNITNISGTVSLPTGAATAAKQPALGTAGTASSDVISVQGISSMTPVQVSQATASNLNATVVGTGTLAVQVDGAALTALQLIDNAVVVLGTATYSEATSSGYAIGAVRRDADTTLVDTTNEWGPLQMDANGRLKVEAFSGETLPVSLVSTTITGTVAVTQSGSWDEVGINDSGNSITVDNNGTFAVQAAGDVANDSGDSGNPVKIGGVGRTTNPTAVTDGDRVNGLFDKLGKQICVGAIRDLKVVQQTTITSSTSETTIVTAVASTFLDLYGLIIANTSGSDTSVTIKDSTAGTTRAVIRVPAGDTRGFVLPVDSAIPQATVNTNWTATCADSVASIQITALAVKNI